MKEKIMKYIVKMKLTLTPTNLIFILIGMIFVFSPFIFETGYKFHLIINNILFVSILCFLIRKKCKYLFEPIYIYSIYYLTVPIVIWYYIYTNFETNNFIKNTTFNSSFDNLFLATVILFTLGYLMSLLGYYKCKKTDEICEIVLEKQDVISDFSCQWIGISLVGVGIINFVYNVFKFADGNVLIYLVNMSQRTSEFTTGGTTLGYTIALVGVYVLLFKMFRDNLKSSKIIFTICFFFVFIMKLSTGRIFNTLCIVGVMISLFYFFSISKSKKVNNKVFIWIGASIIVAGILFYFIRMMGGLQAANQLNLSIFDYLKKFISEIGYYAIDKGNMPNVVLLPKIIDSWSHDIGYLYGSSLFAGILSFFPGTLRLLAPMPAVLVKQTWYMSVSSGNLPVTIIGELFANFGWLGPILGMFIFGFLITKMFRFAIRRKNYWIFLIVMEITIGFVALSPKGEFNNFSLWMILPYVFIYFLLIAVTKIEKKIKSENKK